MSRTCVLVLFLALGLAWSLPVRAAEFSGRYLMHVCSMDKAGREIVPGGHTACQSYIAGILDYHNLIKSLKTAPGIDFCVPKDESLATLHKVVLLYLQKNGQHDGFIASPAVALALSQAYPCRRRSRK